MSPYYILQDGEPVAVDLTAWASWFETADRHVARETVRGFYDVSTVFLGLDHQFGDGPPILFETMVFGGDHEEVGSYTQRYSTWDEAEAGHKRVVEQLIETETGRGPAAGHKPTGKGQ